jgi:predicted MFS family arabinose efflux permease
LRLRRHLPPVLHRRNYALLVAALLAMGLGSQMVAVAVGWQVYAIHHSAFDLGLIGLAEFVPLPILALPAGHLADRFSRRAVLAASLALSVAVTVGLLVVSLTASDVLWPFLVLAAAAGVATALGTPAARALPPMLVPFDLVESAMAVRSIASQIGFVVGPAIGGLLFAVRPELAYGTAAALLAVGLVSVSAVREPEEAAADVPALGVDNLLAGFRFMRRTPVMLGAITLDLFAVLFGGAVALLPLFARSVLHTGPFGLGVLRTAPAVGALLAGVMLTRRPLGGRVGRTLLLVVAAFGACMIVFALSHSFALSFGALAVSGFVDMISMNIRSTTVALATPNELRGRVLAIEMVFVSASNELGAFESGVAAALFGAVTAVVAGGAITIGLAASWPFFFPALAAIDRFEDVHAGRVDGSADRPYPPGSPA